MNAERKTDATFRRAGTRVLPKAEGNASRSSCRAGWQRLTFFRISGLAAAGVGGYHALAPVTREGWLRTRYSGELDDDGCLTTTGCKKELHITSRGKSVAPGPPLNWCANTPWSPR
ncbi:hypothetical protein ADK64_37735 [Streptomyces sp. MMG1121]|nr:hypothetical protein ADK64_37735 [Streptomyces sp. MMG1121]